jgi:PAS domain S-box-containing protein
MIRLSFLLLLVLASLPARAGLLDVFRLEDGHTNWQYVANTTGTLLILALSYTLIRLFFSNREAARYNRELEAIRSQLEQRVLERTATLDESNERLRQSEAYINSIVSSMPLMLIGLDHGGAITQWNWRAEAVSGLKAADVLGHNLWRTYPSITVTPEQVERAKRKNRTLTIKQSQRGQYHFDITIYPLSAQTRPGTVILIDDVTQRVTAENMLIQRDKMSSMGELAGTLAQDISTPVKAMLMDIREVKSRVAEQKIESDRDPAPILDDALMRGEQVSAVISNLLEIASANADEMQLADITSVIDRSLELAEAVLTAPSGLEFKDIKVNRQYATELPLIPCRATELQQVFLSLFRHCIQALGEIDQADHRPEITIQADQFYDALWLKVQHNGRGLSLEEQQVLFEPFFADSTGSGIDDYNAGWRLSYAYFIVTEQHRGQLAVTSDVDIGTTFHIQLLLAEHTR